MNIDYTLWPNTDGNLGEIKVQIPVNAEDWPEGDALIGNFVYKDGYLVGFVDTKALILNESATTTIDYDYVNISLPSITEGTLTINRGPRSKYFTVRYAKAITENEEETIEPDTRTFKTKYDIWANAEVEQSDGSVEVQNLYTPDASSWHDDFKNDFETEMTVSDGWGGGE